MDAPTVNVRLRSSTRAVLALFLLAFAARAQTAFAQAAAVVSAPLTLEQALQLAESRSESIAAARAGIARAEGDITRARSGLFPQLSAFASYDRALASEFEGLFDQSQRPACEPFTLDPGAPLDARVAEIERAIDCGAVGASFFGGADDDAGDLPFGRTNTWRVNLAFSQSVYSGGRLRAQTDLARSGREIAELTLGSTRAQFLFDVTRAYYDAALSDKLVSIAEATIEQAEATYHLVQAAFKAGTQPEFELLRARVARDNQRPALIRQRADREVALLRLKQLLDLPASEPLQLAAALDAPALAPPRAFASRLAAARQMLAVADLEVPEPSEPLDVAASTRTAERIAVRSVAADVQLREAAFAAARAERMPTVSVNSSYGRVAYPSGFFPGLDAFRTNWTVGASVEVPILTGGRLRGGEAVARAELEQSRLQLQQTMELAALDTREAWAELQAARAAWEASSGTIEQAARAYRIAEVRYREGVSTQLELSDARLLLQQAEANRAQAARDLQVARTRIALLPELPLSDSGGLRAPVQPQQPRPPFTAPTPVPLPQPPGGAGQLRNAAAAQPRTPPGGRQ